MASSNRASGGGGGRSSFRATPMTPPASAPDADPASDIASLLAVVRGHQRQHADPAYNAAAPSAIQRCKTMLSKLRKLLPKLMRPVAAAPAGVPMLRDICEIVELLLRGSACPHSRALFIESSGSSSLPSMQARARGATVGTTSTATYPTFATMLFYMVSFFSNARLRDAQESVLRVLLQMALFLQQNDVHGFLHFFRDTVEVLEDAFLLEEALHVRVVDSALAGATIASYLNTAIHVYQNTDGPLGSRSNETLCGCEPVVDEAKVLERKQQLKALLPPIHVDSYSSAIGLRRSMQILAQHIIHQSSVIVVSDPAANKLVQLVQLFMEKDKALGIARRSAGEVRASEQDVAEVAQATHNLLRKMLNVTPSTERRFVRLAQAFYESSTLDPRQSELVACSGSVLKAIRDGHYRISKFAEETLWSALIEWLSRSLFRMEGSVRIPLKLSTQHRREVWLPVVEIVVHYLRTSPAPPRTAVFVDLLGCVDMTALDLAAQSAIVESVHFVLSSSPLLLKFSHSFAKLLQSNSFELGRDGSLSSTSRKRTRAGAFIGASRQSSHPASEVPAAVEIPAHDKLAQWLLDLVFFGSDDASKDVAALSLALRILLPFRDEIASSVARTESYSIFRVLLQRVDSVMSGLVGPAVPISLEVLDFLVVILRHLEDTELGKHSSAFEDIVSTIESRGFFAAEAMSDSDAPWREESWNQLVASMSSPPSKLKTHQTEKDASQSELFTAAFTSDLVSRLFRGKSLCTRAMFLMRFMWSRVRALRLNQTPSWRDTWLWRSISRSVLNPRLPQAATKASIAMTPLLVPLLSRHCRSTSETVTGLLELLAAKIRDGTSDYLRSTIVETAGSILCVASRDLATKTSGGNGHAVRCVIGHFGDPPRFPGSSPRVLCTCWEGEEKPRITDIPVFSFASLLLQSDHSISRSSTTRALSLRCMATFFRHCDLDADGEEELVSHFYGIVDGSLDDPASCQVIADLFGDLVAHPSFVHKLISSVKSSSAAVEDVSARSMLGGAQSQSKPSVPVSFLDTMIAALTRAEVGSSTSMLLALLPILGSLGCACDTSVMEHMEILIWTMLRVVAIWSKAHDDKATVLSASAYDQILRITTHHQISWRKLCVENPEQCYFALTDELLSSRTLRLFLRTFMPDVDATAFLFGSAPYVLPMYVVDQNEEMLQTFVAEFNGTDEGSSGGYEDGSEGDDFRNTTIAELLLNHIEFVLKELIIDQVKVDRNQDRLAEWEFLLKFLPENATSSDMLFHSPLRLLNLIAWELGGARCELAKRAFRIISRELSGEDEVEVIDVDAPDSATEPSSTPIPRQYFLAMMTELGNKIGAKSSSSNSSADKIRAIKSVNQLFGLFAEVSSLHESDSMNSGGIMDQFVPKVMATLKIGLTERVLQEHAMNAWAKFLRMLSVKALESNFCSIVVSVLPCLGYDPSMILQENTILTVQDKPNVAGQQGDSRPEQEAVMKEVGFCWNADLLQKELDRDTQSAKRGSDKPSSVATSVALSILEYLFVEKRAELKQAFPRITILPWIPALAAVHEVLNEDIGVPACNPLGEYLVDLASYINHWDLAVREMALSQLFRCLVVRGRELRALMENEGDLFVNDAVVDIILSILQLARTESQESVKLLCARCMGALGAIDSARMPLSMFYESDLNGGIVTKERLDSRVEHSTKDLACVLIETWLVKELRAAPENTDSVAFAIQELLKFLAELTADPQHSGQNLSSAGGLGMGYQKPKSPAVPMMPDWMKRRFERKDVLQFVEPYWSTSYSISSKQHASGGRRHSGNGAGDRSLHSASDEITYYEKHSTTYEEWLVQWCKRLIHLSQPPERKIFWACQTTLPTCPQIARFLLPYLIQNVLRSGKTDVYEELKREVLAVLNDYDRGVTIDDCMLPSPEVQPSTMARANIGEKASGDDSSRHHQCSQTIFSTIEELNEWVWSSEKKRRAQSSSASLQSAGSARSVDIPSELDDQEKENLEEFLKDIPSRALSNAAFGIEAYARAIQYFEVYLRQQDYKPPDGKLRYSPWPVHLSLISKNAFYLQQLYKSVDEPDALIGLATLRRLYEDQGHGSDENESRLENGFNLTDLMHQIVDHEQLAQWEDALACYEQAIQEIQSALSSGAFFSSASQYNRREMLLPRGLLADPQTDPELVKPELYSGMVGCLIQLGRLESALQHINGIVSQEPEFVGTLFPYALECSWRLSRWELLSDLLSSEKKSALLQSSNSISGGSGTGAGTRLRGIDGSQLKLIRVLHSLHKGELDSFQRNLKDARLEVMGPLAAASAESYQRAYPLLHKLHFLHEVEQGFIYLQTVKGLEGLEQKTELWTRQSSWEARYNSMPMSLKYRDPILALRRVLLQEANLKEEVSHYWLLQAKLARKQGYMRTAASAVMHADALESQYALLEKAKLLVSQDRMYEALQLLEPVDIDTAKIEFNVEDRHYTAKTLLLATNWMQESGLRQGKKVIERYEAVIKFDKKWEKGYFYLAKYYEYLLSVSHPEATSAMGEEGGALLLNRKFQTHLIALMNNYVLALEHGTKFVFQSLPRLLTLWFEYGELFHSETLRASKVNKALRQVEIELSQSSESPTPEQILGEITEVIHRAVKVLPAYEWLVCFPQVTSRICHPNKVVVDGVKMIMVRVLSVYPTQAMWPLLGLSRSLNSQRRNRARDIVASIQRQFVSTGHQDIANSFSEGMRLVEELISLAGHDPANQRRIHIRISRIRSKILVPVQAALTTILPASGLAPSDKRHSAFSPHAQIHIRTFSEKADVMMTKEKPKRIEIIGSDGRTYPFLCKREKTGDLRKDARMMEFNNMINKLLQKDGEGRKRKLRLRTYAVVCLNEESGLMEWVRNTKAMRQLIGQIHKTERGFIQPVRLTHEIKERFLRMQKKYQHDVPGMAEYYRRKVLSLPTFTPRFHQWFYNNFSDPTAWFESRLTFSRSAAVWSMVGHIIGLGDRHGENILIDCTSGECVHVDFDCLFDKGLKLAKPEIVPFRLTPNIIDAFGITGYEGVYRRVCEVTMHLLRENKETLRSVLESFIHDPLVEWGRKGKATQVASGVPGSASRSIAEISNDRSKEETRVMLKTIDDRLRGIYNLGAAIRPHVSSSHRRILPESDTLPLSVQGQVDKLIHEATSHENLAQMYIGWMPFL